MDLYCTPVSILVTVTAAAGMTAPVESATVPRIEPSVPVCAPAETERSNTAIASLMANPLQEDWIQGNATGEWLSSARVASRGWAGREACPLATIFASR